MYKNATYHNLVAQGGAFSFTGTIGSFNLTDDDIMDGSLQIEEAFNADGSIPIGGIVTSQLKLTLNNFTGKFTGETFDESTEITGALTIGDQSVTLPTYHVIDRSIGPNTIDIVALDLTDKLNAAISGTLSGAKWSNVLTAIATAGGMTLGLSTAAAAKALASADLSALNQSKETYKSVLLYILQKLNLYARINGDSQLYIYYFDSTATQIPITSSMVVKLDIDGPHTPTLVAVKPYTEQDFIAAGTPGYNLTLEGNPMITTADPASILAEVETLSFYNFTLDSIADPAVQVGDYIQIAGSQSCIVASKSYALGRYMQTSLHWNFDDKADYKLATNGEQGQAITNEITGAIDDLEIGGRNLLADSNAPTLDAVAAGAARYFASAGSISTNGEGTEYTAIADSPVPGVAYGAKHVCTATGGAHHMLTFYVAAGRMTFVQGTVYTASFWAKSSVAGAQIGITLGSVASSIEVIDNRVITLQNADEWVHFKCTFKYIGATGANYICFGSAYNIVGTVYCCGYKLEIGEKATAWTPATEDVDHEVSEAAKTATSYITKISETDGIKVHDSADDTDYIKINSDAVSMYRDNVEVTRIEDSKITLGKTSDTHTKITSGGFDIVQNSGSSEEVIAHFGYAEGASTSGTAEAPFTSLGKRKASEVVGNYSVAEGYDTIASAYSSHAEGNNTAATAQTSHAEGDHAIASRNAAHAEGYYTSASGQASHAEGDGTTAAGDYSHAEGRGTSASVTASHAEGYSTSAEGFYSHAEGYNTTASGLSSHSEGSGTQAEGYYSHAQNAGTIARGAYQTAIGKYNVQSGTPTGTPSGSSHALIIGNGADDSNRSNALAVDFGGNAMLAGDAYIGCAADSSGGTRLGFPAVNESVTLTNIFAAGMVTGSQKQLWFFVPYAFAGAGTYEITSLSITARFINGVYGYLRSGTEGATYTALGTNLLPLITNGAAVRSGELTDFSVEAEQFSGFRVILKTEYAIARANTATTAVTNNTPVAFQVTMTVKRTA